MTLLRTFIIFFTLLVLTRILGKKQMSQLTFFNYVTGITIGSIAANIVSVSNEPFIDEFAGLVLWCLLTALMGFIGMKTSKLRKVIEGNPTILIKKGKLERDAMKKQQVNIEDLLMMLREKDVFAINEVEYAILEPNGKVSILKKSANEEVTKNDLKIPLPTERFLPSDIIIEGRIVSKNLYEYCKDENWLKNQLKKQSVQSPKEIFYAEMQEDGTLYIEKY